MICYEHPLNERIRTLLRLEDLFERVQTFYQRETPEDHDIAIKTLIDILEVAGRADLKMDLYQELERQRQVLTSYRNSPDVSAPALAEALAEIEAASAKLIEMKGKFGQTLRDNEWLMSIKGRTCIPGGLCEFDLPLYHYWLHQAAETRRSAIQAWLNTLRPFQEAQTIILRLLRASGISHTVEAQNGQYHQVLNGTSIQMVRIEIESGASQVPEVSGNRFALNIRFVTTDFDSSDVRTRQYHDSVPFTLTCCSL